MSVLEEKIVKKRKHEDPPAINPTQCLRKLLMSQEMADLTVIIPGHNDNVKVHRLVLSMWSPVFQAMLFGPMAEGDTITIGEDKPEAFTFLINYMYTGQTELDTIEMALQVYQLGHKYLMRHLQIVCSEYLITCVSAAESGSTTESVPEILNLAMVLEDDALINSCSKVLEESADLFFASTTIEELSSVSLELLLRKDLVVSSETTVYQGILNWGKAHSKYKEQEITSIQLRQEVDKFVPLIRFLTMTLEEFAQHVIPDNILTLTEVETILMNISGVSDAKLPTLLSTSKEKRGKIHIEQKKEYKIIHGQKKAKLAVDNVKGRWR